jgi:hypothetical protein
LYTENPPHWLNGRAIQVSVVVVLGWVPLKHVVTPTLYLVELGLCKIISNRSQNLKDAQIVRQSYLEKWKLSGSSYSPLFVFVSIIWGWQ